MAAEHNDFRTVVEVLARQGALSDVLTLVADRCTAQAMTPELAQWLYDLAQPWPQRGWFEPMWELYDMLIPTLPHGHKLALVLAYRAQLFGNDAKVQSYGQQALQLNPGDPYSQLILCQLVMKHTGFQQGREFYEVRFEAKGDNDARDWREFPVPRWQGEDLSGKRLYLWTEQGFGDVVMFMGFLPHLLAQGAHVTLAVTPRMISLFQRSFPQVRVESSGRSYGHAASAILRSAPEATALLEQMGTHVVTERAVYDYAAPIGDMMVYGMDTFIPAQEQASYLVADPVRMAAFACGMYGVGTERRIGISWHTGNLQNGMVRSVGLKQWEAVLRTPGCRFFSLQHHVKHETVEHFCAETGCQIIQPDFDPTEDIEGLAALIASMDEIITIDNSNAHLAGALGVPTTLLLAKGCNFRWSELVDGGTLWYQRMQAFRQETVLDWAPVMARVHDDLMGRLHAN